MLSRLLVRNSRFLVARAFSDKKPPKGFQKFKKFMKEQQQEKKDQKSSKQEKYQQQKYQKTKQANQQGLVGSIVIVLGFTGGYYIYKNRKNKNNEVNLTQFMRDYIRTGKVSKIIIQVPDTASGNLTISKVKAYDINKIPLATTKIFDLPGFLQSIKPSQFQQTPFSQIRVQLKPVPFHNDSYRKLFKKLEFVLSLFLTVLTTVIALAILHALRKGPGGIDIFNPGKTTFKVFGEDQSKVPIKFSDVAGLKQAKNEVMEFVDFLKSPKRFKKLGARIPKGALLVGPPGTGKTLLAKASAGEAGVPFFSVSGSDFVQMFVGVGASRVRQLFKQARQKAPSIIFIDEIDAVGRKRHGRVGGNDQRDNTLNQLLVEMDGFGTDSNVVIMAGTNRKDILDQALLRPGRFDRTIDISLPDIDGREEIVKIHLKPLILNPEMKMEQYAKRLAALTPGFSGADLASLCNEAAIFAARKNKDYVDKSDFESASERVIGGLEKSKKLNEKQRKIVAYHQAGHAVAGWFLQGADPVLKVSILPRSKGALGFAQFLPHQTMLYSREELIDKICSILGGRVAQELFFGKVTTGAQDDLQKATRIAQGIVSSFGMNEKLGVISYKADSQAFNKPYSQDTHRIIDQEVRLLILECLEKTRILLTSKKSLIENLAQKLLEKERVTQKDLREVLGERPFNTDEEYQKYVEETQ